MQPGCETVFLRRRKGFIRVAMQNASPVVPCFAFGQSATFKWYRLGPPLLSDTAVQALSRRIGGFWLVAKRSTALRHVLDVAEVLLLGESKSKTAPFCPHLSAHLLPCSCQLQLVSGVCKQLADLGFLRT